MRKFADKPLRVFVVWEPVLPADWAAPSTWALSRLPDRRVRQFWDRQRLVSHMMGEHDQQSVVWDYVAVYRAEATWGQDPPMAAYHGGPVVRAIGPAQEAISQALSQEPGKTSASR